MTKVFLIFQYIFEGLVGKDDWEEAKAAEAAAYFQDVANEMMPYFGVKYGFRQGDAVSQYISYIFNLPISLGSTPQGRFPSGH
jgi:hypothetical protein